MYANYLNGSLAKIRQMLILQDRRYVDVWEEKVRSRGSGGAPKIE